jgi:DNA transformation protein
MSEFVDHVLELMRPWAAVTARRMFGGHGLYRDGLMFALEAFDSLYVKVDTQTAPQFAARGCTPFIYEGKGRLVRMSYWTVPPECVESSAEMARWCALGWQAALRAQDASPRPARKRQASRADAKPSSATGKSTRRKKRTVPS